MREGSSKRQSPYICSVSEIYKDLLFIYLITFNTNFFILCNKIELMNDAIKKENKQRR